LVLPETNVWEVWVTHTQSPDKVYIRLNDADSRRKFSEMYNDLQFCSRNAQSLEPGKIYVCRRERVEILELQDEGQSSQI
jgi:hypothetical protein